MRAQPSRNRIAIGVVALTASVLLAGQFTGEVASTIGKSFEHVVTGSGGSEAASIEEMNRTFDMAATADVEYAPFDELVRLSTGALLGIVTTASTGFNLPPGQSYDIRRDDYTFPLIYSEVRIAVIHWYVNEENYPQNEVTVITEGGVAADLLSPEEVEVIESQSPGTFESLLGTVSYSVGDANLVPGDTVALLLYKSDFGFASGPASVPRVTGGAAGAFVVGDEERLFNAVAAARSDHRVPLRLSEFIDVIDEITPQGG